MQLQQQSYSMGGSGSNECRYNHCQRLSCQHHWWGKYLTSPPAPQNVLHAARKHCHCTVCRDGCSRRLCSVLAYFCISQKEATVGCHARGQCSHDVSFGACFYNCVLVYVRVSPSDGGGMRHGQANSLVTTYGCSCNAAGSEWVGLASWQHVVQRPLSRFLPPSGARQ